MARGGDGLIAPLGEVKARVVHGANHAVACCAVVDGITALLLILMHHHNLKLGLRAWECFSAVTEQQYMNSKLVQVGAVLSQQLGSLCMVRGPHVCVAPPVNGSVQKITLLPFQDMK